MSANFTSLHAFFAGAVMICAWAISLFFFRFWRRNGDRLFLCFSGAFLLLAFERFDIFLPGPHVHTGFYLIRLAAFMLILLGILDKNRPKNL